MPDPNEYKDLYDLGYQNVKDAETLERAVRNLNALLVDIRKSPRSSDPQWSKAHLSRLFGGRYLHLEAFGNANYKGDGVRLEYPEKGLQQVETLLRRAPVVLMCACWNRSECHRLHVVRYISSALGIESTHLTRKRVKDIAGPDPSKPSQPTLL